MSALADSLVSSSARPLAVRMRADLDVKEARYQGRRYFVVKEPVGLNYFRFEEEEYVLLTMLDGRTSLDELKGRFEEQFRPQKISLEELQRFLASLHTSGLVIADLDGQGARLKQRGDERRRKERLGSLTNILSIRFKGIDPDRLLDRLYPWVRWCFTPPALLAACLVACAALGLVVIQFDVFQSKLPAFHEFFAAKNWFWLAITLALTKIVHEFGHALACKHFGGECHEMGVMLLVLTPCLYCNVSDSWMLPNRWHRAAIGAAGMFVELCIASLATLLWWFSEPGLFNYLCLSTMFVCSVSTLLFNSNPLLRYDGYYILSDILEIPNLRQKASTILSRKLGAVCLGLDEPDDPFLPQRHQLLFACYSVAAAVYRWIITFSILYFLYKLFEPYRLEVLGQIICVMALYGLVGRPLWQLVRFFRVPGRSHQVKRSRMIATFAGLGAVASAVLFIPLPSAVYSTFELEPRGAASVYVDVPGTLAETHVKPGQRIRKGDPLATLNNIDVQLTMAQLTGERDRFRIQLASLLQQRFRDGQAGMQIAEVRESLATIEHQLEQKAADVDRLELASPCDGTVLPPDAQRGDRTSEDELPTWSGTPLDERNLGALLPESTLFCRVGDPRSWQAVLVIDQADIEGVKPGQHVEIQFDQLPGHTYRGQIAEVARNELTVSSERLSSKSGGGLVTKTDAAGHQRPLSTSYQALVPLADDEAILRIGLCGDAKIHTHWQTLGQRFWRYLRRTFHFKL